MSLGWAGAIGPAVLLAGFLYAALEDWRIREVSDRLWLLLSVIGAGAGYLVWAAPTPLGLGVWTLMSAFVIEHLLPWDVALERRQSWLPGAVEVAAYAGVGLAVFVLAWRFGIGSGGVAPAVIAVLLSVYFARALFELGVLYGGADAKALMTAGILVPLFAAPVVPVPANAVGLLGLTPFPVVVLIDAALFSLGVPIALAVRNLLDGNFTFPRGFTGYVIPVEELPRRFVWVRDPFLHGEEEAVESTEEDVALRRRQADELRAKGATEVWVTPQIPYVVLLFVGSVAAVLAGNLLFDLLAAL
ncbi:MAG: hypothetical protein L3J72_02635 [Thermoplasmata archaeon]|nr:hypothetical protein [Thermoplasmata archaeon]MCI4342151.1 hypothetical protein [Thermoplasmata archaeon]